jgi:3',5'-cyclic AMP phosphodiesterase CpdA
VHPTIAHVSDLHVGRDRRTDDAVAWLALALREAEVDTVLVTGDVTHRGRDAELAAFEALFRPLGDRVVVVPGNHDRLGDDAARLVMPGRRVSAVSRPGLHVVRLDSTAPHNRAWLAAHGQLDGTDLAEVDAAVSGAPAGALVVLMLHHHPLPLPEDHFSERLATWLGWPVAAELDRGAELVERLRGRCDLVLHGHRHAESAVILPGPGGRTLHLRNAGCTPDVGRSRVFAHRHGRIVGERWLDVRRPDAPGRTRAPAAPRDGASLAA